MLAGIGLLAEPARTTLPLMRWCWHDSSGLSSFVEHATDLVLAGVGLLVASGYGGWLCSYYRGARAGQHLPMPRPGSRPATDLLATGLPRSYGGRSPLTLS